MEIEMTEVESGKIVASYEINLGSLNSGISDEEYFSEAWRCAVEDGVAEGNARGNYRFRFRK
jgi:hypothetical protein